MSNATQPKTIWVVRGEGPNQWRAQKGVKVRVPDVGYNVVTDSGVTLFDEPDTFPDRASANARIIELCDQRIAELQGEIAKCVALRERVKGG